MGTVCVLGGEEASFVLSTQAAVLMLRIILRVMLLCDAKLFHYFNDLH